MKAVVATFNQEKALVGTFSVITNLRMELFEALERRGDIPRGKGEGMHEEFPVEQPGARLGTTATITATGARDGQWQCWGGEGISISLFAAHKMEHGTLILCPSYLNPFLKMSHWYN